MASIRKRDDKWQARVRHFGHPDVVKTFLTKTAAERWARVIEGSMEQGQFVNLNAAEHTLLGDVIQRYIQTVTPQKRGSVEESIRLKATLRHRISSLSMTNLTPQEIAGYRDDRLANCKPSTVIRDLAALSSLINHARREWGINIQNPVQMVRKPRMPPGRNRVLTDIEEKTLLSALAPFGRRNPLMCPLVIFAIETAMRRSEILSLHWEHVQLEHRVAFLPITKNGQSRYVPLSSRALEALESIPFKQVDGQVFSISCTAMEASFKKAVIRAGLKNLHFHDLRHTAATRMAKKLPNVIELAAVTGHTSLQMLKRYYHPSAEELARKLG